MHTREGRGHGYGFKSPLPQGRPTRSTWRAGWGPWGLGAGGYSSRPLRGNFCSASKLSAALWSKTAARCFAFSSGHTSTVDSVPFGSIRTTCHPKALASYRSRFILRICAPCRPQAAKGGGRTRQPFALLPYVGRFRFYLANCPPCGRAWRPTSSPELAWRCPCMRR